MNLENQIFSILVFTQLGLNEISPTQLQTDLAKSSFKTLCRQYGLDGSLINSTLQSLNVIIADTDISPFFLVSYRKAGEQPILVYHWGSGSKDGKRILAQVRSNIAETNLPKKLSQYRFIFRIELQTAQLKDMGLLLGYELARWIGFYGSGLVRDLHGDWYALNKNKAFMPVLLET